MKVLVTGASGLLGADIARSFSRRGNEVSALMGRKELDITSAADTITLICDKKPDIVVHSAGFRSVDDAEKNAVMTFAVNSFGSKNIALACEKLQIPMIHISSDSVFDGERDTPYNEYDKPNPVNIYGYSKLLAEQEVRLYCRRHFIVRVPLLFGALGHTKNNYICIMDGKLARGESVEYTTDQLCSPTFTKDVGEALAEIADSEFYGIYHLANEGQASRYSFYKRCAELLGHDTALIKPIKQREKLVRRPKNTLFSSISFRLTFPAFKARNWEVALEECIAELRQNCACCQQ
jgi:dTDP-4-dehydrorhamnose reductase